jgi:hypothetical protein
LLVLALAGCDPGTFDADEAALVFDALASVNSTTWGDVWAGTAPIPGDEDTAGAAEKSVSYHTALDGGDFSGTVEGPGSWTGLVTLDGTYTVSADDGASAWSMDTTWEQVRWSDLHLEGEFTWTVVAEIDGAALTQTSTFSGELTSRGGATGTGTLDYTTGAVYGGGRYLIAASGTIGGNDISSSWDASSAFGL